MTSGGCPATPTARAPCSGRACYDSLTGLANRQLFKDRLTQELTRARRAGSPVALLFIDLDRFKDINDSLGHSAGDGLLQAVGERLRSIVRDFDTLARLGGDEFTLIAPDLGVQGATALAARVLDILKAPFDIGGEQRQPRRASH